jgi:hypothetical protein
LAVGSTAGLAAVSEAGSDSGLVGV